MNNRTRPASVKHVGKRNKVDVMPDLHEYMLDELDDMCLALTDVCTKDEAL